MLTLEQVYEKLLLAEKDEDKGTFDKSKLKLDKVEKEILENGTVIDVIKNCETPPFNVEREESPGSWAKRVRKFGEILKFIEANESRRSKKYCTVMPIPIESKEYLNIWGSRQNVHVACKKMEEYGLIKKFKNYDKKNHQATLYKYFYKNEKLFFDYCRKHKIAPITYKEKFNVELSDEIRKLPWFNSKEVKFSYDLNLLVPNDIDKQDFEYNFIRPSLYENYCGYLMWKEKIEDEINPFLEKEDSYLRLSFEPHLTWGTTYYKKTNTTKTYVRKIGIRLSNKLVGLSKKERKEYRDEHGLFVERDVKSSVPRLTKSLHNKKWIDESIDIYKLISKELDPDVDFTPYRRDVIKKLHMRAYFNNKGPKDIANRILFDLREKEIDISDINKKELEDLMAKYRNAMVKAEDGEPFGNEIFYVESMVYLMTLYDLIKAGHQVFFVFDCFYCKAPKTREKELKKIIGDSIEINFTEFMVYYLGWKLEDIKSGLKMKDIIKKLGL